MVETLGVCVYRFDRMGSSSGGAAEADEKAGGKGGCGGGRLGSSRFRGEDIWILSSWRVGGEVGQGEALFVVLPPWRRSPRDR